MKKTKNRYPTYKELIKMKIKNLKADKILQQENENRNEINRVKKIAEDNFEFLGVTKEEIFNAMGLYRFK